MHVCGQRELPGLPFIYLYGIVNLARFCPEFIVKKKPFYERGKLSTPRR
jgi:hypothetical protein